MSEPFRVEAGAPFGDLSGLVVVITGGNSGIGLGIGRGLVAAGARVAVLGTNPERTARAALELTTLGPGEARGHVCDVGDEAAVIEVFARVRTEWGPPHGLVASAGVGSAGAPFIEETLDDWRQVMRVNLDGAFLTFREAARHMVDAGIEGSLVAIASLSATLGQVRGQSYSASKGGMTALVRACATELARYGIRANAILPGTIDTPLAAAFIEAPHFERKTVPRIPMRRAGHIDELAGAALYLLSPAARYHSGDTLVVDGGYAVY